MKQLIAVLLCLTALPAFGASCFIREFTTVQNVGGQTVQVPLEPANTQQVVNFTTSTASNAFNDRTNFIGIICDAKAHMEISTDPTAETSDFFLPANAMYFTGVTQGTALKVAFVTGS